MRNLWVIFSREMKSYFNSPIAYIFVIVFVVLTCGLYMASFFLAERADMRAFFSLLPIILIVFVPAITMRLWAEDKKMGTIELLLTFPMKSWQILLGKFLASFAFLTIALAGTLTLPIIVSILGRPDPGPLIGGYLGSLLLGAFFLSIGLFISGLCKDQIVAFILSVIGCFFFFFIGTEFFTAVIGGWLGAAASFLQDYVGLTRHFDAIQRGVIDVRALIYFITMTVLFLALNAIYLEGRLRPKAKTIFAGAIVLLTVAAVMINVVAAGFRAGRFDLTQGKIFTVSQAAKRILRGLRDAVRVKYYASSKDKMPAAMKTIRQDVTDKLEEFRIASGNMLQYKVYDPSVDPLLAQRIDKKGVKPLQATTVDRDEFSTRLIYSAIMISYADKKDEIIPEVSPKNFDNLEYELISRIFRLTLPKQPSLALYAPTEELSPQLMQMYTRSGRTPPPPRDNFSGLEQWLRSQEFDVSRIKLAKGDTIPQDATCVLIINPRDLNDRQRYEINRALVEGKNVLLAVQKYTFDYRPVGMQGVSAMPQEVKPQVNELIQNYGATVDDQFLMDRSNATLSVPSGQRNFGGLFRMTVTTPVKIPTHIVAIDQNMNHNVSITNRLDSVLYLWGTRININDDKIREAGLKSTVLMSSSPESWTVPFHATPLAREDVIPPADKYEGPQPLMVMLSGQFPDAFKGKKRPDWPPPQPRYPGQTPPPPSEEEKPEKPLQPHPAKLILIGCSQTFTNNFIRSGGNALLASNCVDALALGDELINIRSKPFTDRSIRKTKPAEKVLYRFLAMALVPIFFIALGITRYILIRKGKERYLKSLAAA